MSDAVAEPTPGGRTNPFLLVPITLFFALLGFSVLRSPSLVSAYGLGSAVIVATPLILATYALMASGDFRARNRGFIDRAVNRLYQCDNYPTSCSGFFGKSDCDLCFRDGRRRLVSTHFCVDCDLCAGSTDYCLAFRLSGAVRDQSRDPAASGRARATLHGRLGVGHDDFFRLRFGSWSSPRLLGCCSPGRLFTPICV